VAVREWVVEPYESGRHLTDAFSCGSDALDAYIRKYASQDARKRVANVFVACELGGTEVVGYYTVSATSFSKEGLPATRETKQLPRYPVPASIMGRLAVHRLVQGQRLGEYLLVDCAKRVIAASRQVAVYALVVDAKDESAKTFYRKYGFLEFVDQPMRLFIPIRTLENALGRSA